MSSLFNLDGRVVVVTGGRGQLGRQFSAALIEHGARVAVLDLGENDDRSLGGLIREKDRDRLFILNADVTSRASLEIALANICNHWTTPFGLVNNAALDAPPDAPASENGPYETYPDNSFDRVLEVNIKGVHLSCQVFGGAMTVKRSGSIVNIGSIYGMLAPDQSLYEYRRQSNETFFKPVAYSVSKSALYNLTRYLAVYWGNSGVRVNTVTFAGVFNNQDTRFLDRYLPKVPLGRMADESDYNGTMVYLMSDASRYMTGSNVIVDGGYSAM